MPCPRAASSARNRATSTPAMASARWPPPQAAAAPRTTLGPRTMASDQAESWARVIRKWEPATYASAAAAPAAQRVRDDAGPPGISGGPVGGDVVGQAGQRGEDLLVVRVVRAQLHPVALGHHERDLQHV